MAKSASSDIPCAATEIAAAERLLPADHRIRSPHPITASDHRIRSPRRACPHFGQRSGADARCPKNRHPRLWHPAAAAMVAPPILQRRAGQGAASNQGGMRLDGTIAARPSMPGLKGEARRAAQGRPLTPEACLRHDHAGGVPQARPRRRRAAGTTRALLRRLGKEFLPELRHHKAFKPGIAAPTRRPCTALCRQGLRGF